MHFNFQGLAIHGEILGEEISRRLIDLDLRRIRPMRSTGASVH